MQEAPQDFYRDEFGGYCCKRSKLSRSAANQDSQADICKSLGLDIERIAEEIVAE